MYFGETKIQDEHRQKVFEALSWLNTLLEGHKYLAETEHATLADMSLLPSVANFSVSLT